MTGTVDPSVFLEDQFPRKFWPLVPTTLKAAYAAAEATIKADPIFQVESARDNRGRIISWATDLGFVKLIETGLLPFDFRWQSYEKPTGRYLQIRLPHSVASISQVTDPKKQPRNVRFRENARLNNEPFFDLPEFEEDQSLKGLPHILLIHGHQELRFAHLAIPHHLDLRAYRHRTENLMLLPHAVPETGPGVEDTDVDFDAIGLLKEEIEKWQRDHGE